MNLNINKQSLDQQEDYIYNMPITDDLDKNFNRKNNFIIN